MSEVTNTNTNATNLRDPENEVRVEGYLSEKNLEVKQFDGVDTIVGDLKIQTSETNVLTFRVYTPKLKKDKTPNKIYDGIATVMNEYKSIAKDGKENADRIRITAGQMNPNTYFVNGQELYNIQYRSSFFNRVAPGKEGDLKAEAIIELFVKAIVPEMNKEGEPTGRVIVKGLMPLVSSDKNNVIEPVDLIAPAEDGIAEAIEDSDVVTPGKTVTFYANIINNVRTYDVEVPVLIGKPRIEKKTERKEELIITNVKCSYDPEDENSKAFDPEVIRKAVTERETRLAEKKAASSKPANAGSTSGAKSAPKASGRGLPF